MTLCESSAATRQCVRHDRDGNEMMKCTHISVPLQGHSHFWRAGTLRIFGELVQKLRRKSMWTPKNAECPWYKNYVKSVQIPKNTECPRWSMEIDHFDQWQAYLSS
jgi:hypothetical protein